MVHLRLTSEINQTIHRNLKSSPRLYAISMFISSCNTTLILKHFFHSQWTGSHHNKRRQNSP
uniref:Uncharacterized protein n=1 Tax=Anguilla anguilla TaxID=7936 RepID=A0A0E9WPZ3_ANGAN